MQGLTDGHEEEREPVRRCLVRKAHVVHGRPGDGPGRYSVDHGNVQIAVILLGFLFRTKDWLGGHVALFSVTITVWAPSSVPPAISVSDLLRSSPKSKAILDEGDAKPRTGAEARSVCGVEEIGEEETDELEGYGDQQVPKEGKQ